LLFMLVPPDWIYFPNPGIPHLTCFPRLLSELFFQRCVFCSAVLFFPRPVFSSSRLDPHPGLHVSFCHLCKPIFFGSDFPHCDSHSYATQCFFCPLQSSFFTRLWPRSSPATDSSKLPLLFGDVDSPLEKCLVWFDEVFRGLSSHYPPPPPCIFLVVQ